MTLRNMCMCMSLVALVFTGLEDIYLAMSVLSIDVASKDAREKEKASAI